MIENEILHQAILENPSDIDARLVYGDWLAEHSDPRGDFIQNEVAAGRSEKWSTQFADFLYRAQKIANEHRESWSTGIEEIVENHQEKIKTPKAREKWVGKYQFPNPITYQYRIGFADSFCFRYPPSDEYLSALMAVTPVRRLCFLQYNGQHPLNTELLSRVGQFEFRVTDHCKNLNAVLGKKSKLNLEWLKIYASTGGQGRYSEEMQALAKLIAGSNCLHNLRSFNINAPGFGVSGVKRLVESNAFANLRSLTLVEGDFGDEGFSVLLNSDVIGQLKHLKVKLTGIGDAGFQHLAESGAKNLKRLSMGWWYGSNPSSKGFSAITSSPDLAGLYHLDLQGWPMGEDCFRLLCESESLSGIRILNLANTDLDDTMAERLANSNFRLRCLNLEANPKLTAKGFQLIADSPIVNELTWLNLRDSLWGSAATKTIAASTKLKELRYLSMAKTGLDSTDVARLLRADNLSQLRELDLSSNDLQPKALNECIRSPTLQTIRLTGSKVSEKLEKKLTERFHAGAIF